MDVLSTIGLFLVVLISVKIQLLRIFPTRASGGFFRVSDPFKFKNMDFVRFKYLDNVGIYAQWPFTNKQQGTNNNATGNELGYLWLADINEVIDETFLGIRIRTDYEQNQNGNYTLCLAKSRLEGKKPFLRLKKIFIGIIIITYFFIECYKMNKDTGYFNKVSSGTARDRAALQVTSLVTYNMLITKEPRQAYRYLHGYIDYNMNKISDDQRECVSNQEVGSILYAKFMPFVEGESKSHMRPMADRFSLFNREVDLQTVDKYWRTGVLSCQMTGDLGPKYNQRLRVEC